MSYNEKLSKIELYQPLTGNFNIYMDANESYNNLPPEVIKEIADNISKIEFNRYPDYNCNDLRAAAATVFGIPAGNIVAGNGSDEIISIITNIFLQKGESVLAIEPDFSMYKFYAHINEVTYLHIDKNSNANINTDEFIKQIKELNPRLIIFSNPCNPTGQAITAYEVERIVASTSSIVVVDEAYMEFYSESVIPLINKYSNLIVLKTLSKCYSSAAIRLGFAIACEELIYALNSARSPYNVSALTQEAGKVVLKNNALFKDKAKQIIANKQWLYNELARLTKKYPALGKVYDSHTNFVFIKTNNAKYIYDKLLQSSIKIRLGTDNLRITTATAEDNNTFIQALTAILDEMKQEA